MSVRVGQGWDVHRLVAGRPLMIGGVRVPFECGALGHSDGDVLLHAVCDAVLGALGLGDIGTHFPDTDPTWRGADSRSFVRSAAERMREQGWTVGNLDGTVLLERPRLRPYVDEIRKNIAALLDCEDGRVSVKAKTMEGLGPIGAGEAIAAAVVVLLQRD